MKQERKSYEKITKIPSLALYGTLAVSMMAGCGNTASTGTNNTGTSSENVSEAGNGTNVASTDNASTAAGSIRSIM